MAELAKPKVFAGPRVELQDELVKRLEAAMETLETPPPPVSFLGALELASGPEADGGPVTPPHLVDLENRAPMDSVVDLIKDDKEIHAMAIENTLATMQAAGQLEYLESSGLLASDAWKVVVEIHYYRDRNPAQTKFHKDTVGRTLFVNLNFLNDAPVAGPEVVQNPPTSEEYIAELRERLPRTFVEDLLAAREGTKEPSRVDATVVPRRGVVAFVDEALHHKTPTKGHRSVTFGSVLYHLEKLGGDMEAAANAWRGCQAKKSTFTAQLKATGQDTSTVKAWWSFLSRAGRHGTARRLDRHQLTKLGAADLFDIDELIQSQSGGDFTNAAVTTIVGGERRKRDLEVPGLKREMSDDDLMKHRLREVRSKMDRKPRRDARRSFFRTWVRAEPR